MDLNFTDWIRQESSIAAKSVGNFKKYIHTDYLLVAREKSVTALCQGQHLDQMIKTNNITNEGQIDVV